MYWYYGIGPYWCCRSVGDAIFMCPQPQPLSVFNLVLARNPTIGSYYNNGKYDSVYSSNDPLIPSTVCSLQKFWSYRYYR
jgi:hypothetical protein